MPFFFFFGGGGGGVATIYMFSPITESHVDTHSMFAGVCGPAFPSSAGEGGL